jgi:hypothetical protein
MNTPAPAQAIRLVITMVPGQQPRIEGPLQDKMLCYALLEVARDAIKDFKAPLVVVPSPVIDLKKFS